MKKGGTLRFSIILLLFVGLYALIVVKLFYWQVVKSQELQKIGRIQSTERLHLETKRGEIITSDNYPLATNAITYLLHANPKIIKEKSEYVSKLQPILELPESSISAKLNKDLYWVKLADTLSQDKKNIIDRLNLSGIGFEQENSRLYPESSMAAQLIGFVGRDEEGDNKGYVGIEGYYDEQLKGRPGELFVVKDALGNSIINDVREEKKIDGRSLTLTIDRTVQFFAEKKLKEGIEKYQADGGSVIIMESTTGKILAMVSFPRFDPQKYSQFSSEYFVNPAISSLYEPGSTFKVLVMAGALDLELVKADTKCNICDKPITVGEYTIKTWNDKYYPNTTMAEVIQHSNNTGMVFVARKLGLSGLLHYLRAFGIGEATEIDLQGEASGEIRTEDSWYPIDLATASFGQGITLTPLQLLSAVNAIAAGGNLMKPYVVSKIIEESGKVIEVKPKVKRRVIRETTAKVVTWMMVNAIEKGESKWTKIAGYKIAGKTGTAQIPVAGHYDPDKTIASFVGFFPADSPKLTMLILIDKPKTSIYGSETAAPIFFTIARDLIQYYNLPASQ